MRCGKKRYMSNMEKEEQLGAGGWVSEKRGLARQSEQLQQCSADANLVR